MQEELIAPCGMNCNLCNRVIHPERYKAGACPGCQPRGRGCIFKKGLCARLRKQSKEPIRFCFECDEFPCANLHAVDDRYQRNYNCSLIGNLRSIQGQGLPAFLREQADKYTCTQCGRLVSVHEKGCSHCRAK